MALLSFVIVPSRVNSDGSHTIRLKITNVNTTRYILTKYKVGSVNQLQNGRVVKHPQAILINQKLNTLLSEYEDILATMHAPRATATEIKSFLEQPRFMGNNLRDFAIKYIADLKSNGQASYAQNMGYTLKYLTECFGENIVLQSINANMIKMWEKWLARMGYSQTTINIRMTHLKALLNAAVTEGIVEYKIFPLRGYKMPTKNVREIWISRDELKRLREAEFTGVSARRHTVARDLFMLSFYFAGINLTDLMDAHLNADTINFVRKKTASKKTGERATSLTIQPEARAIIDKYITEDGTLDFGYNFREYEQFRSFVTKGLNKIGVDMGFENKLMYYSARKTFVQFGQQLGIPLYVLEYAIGQSIKEASRRPIFDYMRVMRYQADLAIRTILDYAQSGISDDVMPMPEWARRR